jgi:hypothetical protein
MTPEQEPKWRGNEEVDRETTINQLEVREP